MRYIVVDDDRFFLDRMSILLKDAPVAAETILCGFDNKAVKTVKDDDVFFLDIDDGGDEDAGIRLARRIRTESAAAHIVFITSHDEKLRDSLAGLIRPSEFLIKPINGREKEKLYAFLSLIVGSGGRVINLKSGARHFDVCVNDILYVKKDDRKTSVFTENSFFQVRQSFSKVLEMLDEKFLVVDKGTAVNIEKVRAYEPEKRLIHMKDGTAVYCSRDRARLYRDVLGRSEVK